MKSEVSVCVHFSKINYQTSEIKMDTELDINICLDKNSVLIKKLNTPINKFIIPKKQTKLIMTNDKR